MTPQIILHILKKNDALALDVIRRQAASNAVTILLIQEAADLSAADLRISNPGVAVFALKDDAKTDIHYPHIGYDEMLDHILAADRIVTW